MSPKSAPALAGRQLRAVGQEGRAARRVAEGQQRGEPHDRREGEPRAEEGQAEARADDLGDHEDPGLAEAIPEPAAQHVARDRPDRDQDEHGRHAHRAQVKAQHDEGGEEDHHHGEERALHEVRAEQVQQARHAPDRLVGRHHAGAGGRRRDAREPAPHAAGQQQHHEADGREGPAPAERAADRAHHRHAADGREAEAHVEPAHGAGAPLGREEIAHRGHEARGRERAQQAGQEAAPPRAPRSSAPARPRRSARPRWRTR